ncbi:MAG TPA: PaaI family thioesterase [Actinomycetota bacterium]|nr:PaaI family thioesterase [Actinomycetota bacterium]
MVAEPTPEERPKPRPPQHDDLQQLADAMRRLVELTATLDAAPDGLQEEVDRLVQIADRLEPYAPGGPFRISSRSDLERHWDRNPLVGRLNPLAPPVRIEYRDGACFGYANLGPQYEGPPGYAHGGVVASVFDQLLGLANVVAGNPGMTGTLTIKYRSPTPLRTDLEFECRNVRVDGRKSFTVGTCTANGVVTAEAEGVFIAIGAAKADEYFNEAAGSSA